MKLLIAGNLVNHGYFLVKLLRKYNVSADLLIKKNSIQTEDPKHFDNEISDYPDWIRFWDGTKFSWKYQVISIMREYEVIQASTELPIFSLFSGKPYVAFSTGSDIQVLAYKNTLKGFLLRAAYRRAKIFIFPSPYMYPAVKKLKIKNAIFVPLLWDYTKFNPVNKSDEKKPFTIFHPTNHIWEIKKNDIFLKAFARLAKDSNDIHLITINRGSDFKRSMEILDTPYCKGKFTVIPSTISQKDLPKFYNEVDAVADQFGLGSTGVIGQEAMASSKPLIQYVDKSLYERFYSEAPPIVNAHTEQEVYDALTQLINDRELAKKIGKESREWLLKHHNHEKIIRKYIMIYDAVKDGMNAESIKETVQQIN